MIRDSQTNAVLVVDGIKAVETVERVRECVEFGRARRFVSVSIDVEDLDALIFLAERAIEAGKAAR